MQERLLRALPVIFLVFLTGCNASETETSEKEKLAAIDAQKSYDEIYGEIEQQVAEEVAQRIEEDIRRRITEDITKQIEAEMTNEITEKGNGKWIEGKCEGWDECDDYCHSFSVECENYCRGRPENNYCKIAQSHVFEEGARLSVLDYEDGTPFGRRDWKCNEEFELFSTLPMKAEEIQFIEPLGKMIGGHITPTDHQYYTPAIQPADVFAPGPGHIIKIERGNIQEQPDEPVITTFGIVLEHSCDVYSNYLNLAGLPEWLEEETGTLNPGEIRRARIPVEEGKVIGRLKEYTLDFAVVDTRKPLPGFVNPKNEAYYYFEPWKIWTQNPFDYFEEPLREQLIAKSLRTYEPIGGKIDYDIDGRLAGNWFLESGHVLTEKDDLDIQFQSDLAFAYNYLDPSRIVVSIGNYNDGRPAQFGVKSNAPDPAKMSIDSGLVKYELVDFDFYLDDGSLWDRTSLAKIAEVRNYGKIKGAVLVKMLDGRTIKFEAFPGKTAKEVTEFTYDARIYVR